MLNYRNSSGTTVSFITSFFSVISHNQNKYTNYKCLTNKNDRIKKLLKTIVQIENVPNLSLSF